MKKIISLLRDFKPTYILYSFLNRKKLSTLRKKYKELGLKKNYYAPIKRKDFKNIEETPPWLDIQDSSKELPANSVYKTLPDKIKKAIINWSADGYAIIPSFFSSTQVDLINEEVDKLIKNKEARWQYVNKIMFAIDQSEKLMDVALNNTLVSTLSTLLGKKVFPFSSINFLVGSQQDTHSDSIHMTTFPLGYLIAVWIALEDIQEGSGVLHYYPKSHKLPYVLHDDYDHGGNILFFGENNYLNYEKEIAERVKNNDLKKKKFTAKKGDVFIWHANLLHGGDKILKQGSSRKSMVLHFFAEDVICYHEITQRPALINK